MKPWSRVQADYGGIGLFLVEEMPTASSPDCLAVTLDTAAGVLSSLHSVQVGWFYAQQLPWYVYPAALDYLLGLFIHKKNDTLTSSIQYNSAFSRVTFSRKQNTRNDPDAAGHRETVKTEVQVSLMVGEGARGLFKETNTPQTRIGGKGGGVIQ